MPGPAPKRNARRTNYRPDWVQLPGGGCTRPAPAWPRSRKPTKAQAERWVREWAKPQAERWHDMHIVELVARYVTNVLAAESPEATAAQQAEVRQLEDRLGLSPMALKRLQWEIVAEAAEKAPERDAEVTQIAEYRELYGAG